MPLFLVTVFSAGLLGISLALPAECAEGPDWHEGLPRQHHSQWRVHDLEQPKPATVVPGERIGAPPADAVVLFDGESLSRWRDADGGPANWKVENGYMEVNNTGNIWSRQEFGDCQLHLEYRAPSPVALESQQRGNSGISFMGRYEVQLLDNFNNPTYSDGYIGAVYGQHPPLVNASRAPGEWQSFDIVFRAPQFREDKLVEPGRLTVFLNGILVQHNAEIYGETVWRQRASYAPHPATGPLALQDHGDRQGVRFRNIWVRPLDLGPAD